MHSGRFLDEGYKRKQAKMNAFKNWFFHDFLKFMKISIWINRPDISTSCSFVTLWDAVSSCCSRTRKHMRRSQDIVAEKSYFLPGVLRPLRIASAGAMRAAQVNMAVPMYGAPAPRRRTTSAFSNVPPRQSQIKQRTGENRTASRHRGDVWRNERDNVSPG